MTTIPNMNQLMALFNPHIERIVPVDSFARIKQIGEKLPPLPGAILEYHLGDTKPRVDFSIRATSNYFGRDLLADANTNKGTKKIFQTNSNWQSIGVFLNKWADKTTLTNKTIENVWLEFDNEKEKGLLPTPSLFFDIDRKNQLSLDSKLEVVETALQHLQEAPSTACLLNIRHCLNLVPNTAQLYYIGKMFSRKTAALRLCILGMKPKEIPFYLSSIDWAGNMQEVGLLLKKYTQHVASFILDLEIADTLQNKLGLEVSLDARKPILWDDFFSLLVKHGYCSKEEAVKLLGWRGKVSMPKGSFQQKLSKLMNREVRYLIRRINHVKFGVNKNGELSVKVYLYFCYF